MIWVVMTSDIYQSVFAKKEKFIDNENLVVYSILLNPHNPNKYYNDG